MTHSTNGRRPLRVLMVLTYYHPHWTGLTAYAKRLAEGLVLRGHRVTVLTSRHDSTLAAREHVAGVDVVRLPVALRLSRGVVMPSFPLALRRLLADADVVQMHTPLLEAPLVTALARWRGVPTLFTHHGDLVMPAGAANRVVERLVTGAMRGALAGVTAVSVHSGDYAANSSFLAPFAEKVHAIFPPVDLPPPDRAAAAAWRRSLGLDDTPVVAFAGRWVEEKGFDYLLRAVPLVARALPDVRFVYAGEAPAYEDFAARCRPLRDAVADRLVELGLLTTPQRLADFYAMSDVFALPSRTDCFPSAQLEAVLSGTPVVATDIPGAREVVQRTSMGLLVPPHDPAALADGLVRVLTNRAAYVRSPESVRAVFDRERSVRAYEALLGVLANGRRR